MIQKKYKSRSRIEIVLVFLIFLISTRASGFANSNFFLFSVLFFSVIVAIGYKIKLDKSFFIFLFFLLLIFLENFIQIASDFDVLRYIKLLCLILMSYLTIKIVRLRYFSYFNKIIYYAVLISFPFYIWQLLSKNSLKAVGMTINSLAPFLFDVNENSLNILVYTVEFVENFRNSGPMWEPGGFATIIVLAIYFEFLINKFIINKKIIIYIIGIITTFSTTGYLLLILTMFYYLINRSQVSKSRSLKPIIYLIASVFAVISAFVFLQSDILYEKIVGEYTSQMDLVKDLENYKSLAVDYKRGLGRFGSLFVDLESIKDNWLFGRGYTDETFRANYEQIVLSNGLSNFVGRLGLIGFIWLVWSLSKSGKVLLLELNSLALDYNYLCILVLLISFSNPILFTPIYLILQLFFIPIKLSQRT